MGRLEHGVRLSSHALSPRKRRGSDSQRSCDASPRPRFGFCADVHEPGNHHLGQRVQSDETEAICREYAARNPRVRYVRQPRPLTAAENFRAVVDASHGEFFLWAAYDDLRDADYVEILLRGLDRHPDASICFSEVAEFTCAPGPRRGYTYSTSVFQTLGYSTHGDRQAADLGVMPSHLRFDPIELPAPTTRGSARLKGGTCRCLARYARPFVFEPGTTFTYYRPAEGLSNEQRALVNNFRPLTFWWPEELAWACAGAIADGTRRAGHPIHRGRALAIM